jgi:hypothetical protein
MKTYTAILIGIVVLCLVVFGGYFFIKRQSAEPLPRENNGVLMKTLSGEVIRELNGQNKLMYNFDIPETATTTIDVDGALIDIFNESNPYATLYISYEGGRRFDPIMYIDEIIAPHVSVMNPTEITKIGLYDWQGAESEGSEWHVAPVLNGEWLVIVQNKKTMHDAVLKTLESFKVN